MSAAPAGGPLAARSAMMAVARQFHDLVVSGQTAVANARSWRRAGIAFGAGLASVLAMAPFFAWPVLFFSLPVLVWLLDGEDGAPSRLPSQVPAYGQFAAAAWAGWWFGFGYFFAGLFWIGEAFLVEADKFAWALPFAITILPAGLALFWAVACAAARSLWRPGLSRVVLLAVTLAGAEWLRGHVLTGLPWNVLGYALTAPLPLMQGAGLVGIYGLTLWVVLIAAAPAILIADAPRHGAPLALLRAALLAGLPLLAMCAYGQAQLTTPRAEPATAARLRIVQPSIVQRDKWKPDKQREIFETHLDLSRRNETGARDDLHGITHVIWPEASMPFMPLDTPEALSAIADLLPPGRQLISGALRLEPAAYGAAPPKRRAFNSLMVFDDGGNLVTLYDKIHLVPFGEYLPFQDALEALGFEQLTRQRGGFTPGPVPRPSLPISGLPRIGGLICYEAIFPATAVQSEPRPELLVNLTNDGWFGATTGPHQHFHQSRVRAVEEGLPLVRVANNGISAVIDPVGRVIAKLDLNVKGVIDSAVPKHGQLTPYARFGDALFLLNAVVFLLAAAAFRGRPANRATAGHP